MRKTFPRKKSGFTRVAVMVISGLSMPGAVAMVAGLPMVAMAQEEPLPIRGITLYRSGVGYFERRGRVEGDQTVQLRFATDQINDILKSMVILDRDGGRIDGVSYGSKEPLQRRLSSFGIDLSDQPNLGTIIARLRGAPVKFTMLDGEAVQGSIIGGETRPEMHGNAQAPVQVPYVNVLSNEGIKSVNLTKVASTEILDAKLRAELTKALEALAEHRGDREKGVDISFSGDGARDAIVAYVHEMPVWKTSYRLVLPDGEGGRPLVQGWAIVENTTDQDWENVELSLVSGRPVSFRMDLYEPLFMARPQVPVPMIAGVLPRIYEESRGFEQKAAMQDAIGQRRGGRAEFGGVAASPAPSAPSMEAGKVVAGFSAGELVMGLDDSQATGGEVGEVFRYRLDAPVTIERQRSAMLPILASEVDGRRVSIYSRGEHAEHPMRGVEITNSTDLQLMPGPMSVFDGAAYAGDAQIGHITPGATRLLAYAVDLDVRAMTTESSVGAVQTLKIVDGLIHQTRRLESKVSYAFDNKDAARPRTILVEHQKNAGWDLVAPKKPAEETQGLYRFEVEVEPGKTGVLDVIQARTDLERIAVANYDLGTLMAYARNGKVSKDVIDAVRKAAGMEAAIRDTERAIQTLDQERGVIDQDQTRIRQNMQSISRDTDLYRRYMSKLDEQESRLESIREERLRAAETMEAQRDELASFLRGLNVE